MGRGVDDDSGGDQPHRLLERDEPLAFLGRRLDSARRGRGGTVFVRGEAGIGKTALLRAFAQECGVALLLWGACEAIGISQPLTPLFDMADEFDNELKALLVGDVATGRLFTALLAMIQRARQPVVMVIEDLHWADQATLELVRFLGRRAGFLKLLLIVSHRTEDMTAEPRISELLGDLGPENYRDVVLAPLSPVAVGQLAGQAGYRASEVYRITNGNPFFVTELLAGGRRAGGALPSSVRAAVWARAAKLDAECRALLELVSVMPSGASRPLLARLGGGHPDDAIDRCLNAGLLVEAHGALRFRHELARHAIRSRLSQHQQRAFHIRIADALAGWNEEKFGTEIVGLRLHHAVMAGDGALVLELAPLAAAQVARLGAHREAADFLQQALAFVDRADTEQAAEIWEHWSYEAALAQRIDDAVIAARHRAIALWRQAGRTERVGLNLRWLWRLHWYRGEADLAQRFADEAIATLQTVPPGAELAMSYSMRSQWHMLHDHRDEAVAWGRKAIALADTLGAVEARVHALNNIGATLLSAGDRRGRADLDESLALALAHDFHEHAARYYTNLTEVSTLNRDLATAQEVSNAGIAFDTLHDLDSWLYYLYGCQARILFDRGRYDAAEAIARYVLGLADLTLIMRLMAGTVLGRVRLRRGDPAGRDLLEEALRDALTTGEPQRIVPLRLALAEAAWIDGDDAGCVAQVAEIEAIAPTHYHPWELGEAACWACRAGAPGTIRAQGWQGTAWALETAGKPLAAAERWQALGMPFEEAMALACDDSADAPRSLGRAVALLERIGAAAIARRLRARAQAANLRIVLPPAKRGPYRAARFHPLGLTAREQEVLAAMATGASNTAIAAALSRSPRTIEHHVAAILAKFGCASRMEVMLRVHREPWLLETGRR